MGPLARFTVAKDVVADRPRIDFNGRIAQDVRHAAVVQELHRTVRPALEKTAIHHPSPKRHVIDVRAYGSQPLDKRLVDLRLSVRPPPNRASSGDGEHGVTLLWMFGEPPQAAGMEEAA